MKKCYDVCIIGAGIIGAAVSRALITRFPTLSVCLVEKEHTPAFHQTGRNSGVIHAGIYYAPGSLRAKLCVEGLRKTYEFCDKHDVAYKRVGKLVVATNTSELDELDTLFERASQNNVPDLAMLDAEGIRRVEPLCVGLRAIHSPHTGIVDYSAITRKLLELFDKATGDVFFNFEVKSIRDAIYGEGCDLARYPLSVQSQSRDIRCSRVISCAGLHADRVARLAGGSHHPSIVPFRGEYLVLRDEKARLINGNIYPVPNVKFPFLGVHFTPRMDGSVWLGPNAVLSLKREGYTMSDVSWRDVCEIATNSGLLKFGVRNIGFGVSEIYKSLNPRVQIAQAKRFVPSIEFNDFIRKRREAGVRAQAVESSGKLVDDFSFDVTLNNRALHVRNAPSPAATSSLAIAETIVDKSAKLFCL